VIRLIRRYRPNTFHPSHGPHPITTRYVLARESWFYPGCRKCTKTPGRQEASAEGVLLFMQWHQFIPSFIVDVTAEAMSVRAMQASVASSSTRKPRTGTMLTPRFLNHEEQACIYGDRI